MRSIALLSAYCPAELLEPQSFFANYQVLRHLWLAASDLKASAVFLFRSATGSSSSVERSPTTAMSRLQIWKMFLPL